MRKFELSLTESEVKLLLEALTETESRMAHICETSKDEDEVAEIGNDLTELRLLLNPLREKAVQQYGESILQFSRELL
jgi:hypothetical protein